MEDKENKEDSNKVKMISKKSSGIISACKAMLKKNKLELVGIFVSGK